MSQVNKFLGRVNSDLEGYFSRTRQSYRYYMSFWKKPQALLTLNP